MSDFDTRQISQIAELEERIRQLQIECSRYKIIADLWEPKVSSKTETNEGRVTLKFGGNVFGITIPKELLFRSGNVDSVTSSVVNALCANLVNGKLREIVLPEVQRLSDNALSIESAGKW